MNGLIRPPIRINASVNTHKRIHLSCPDTAGQPVQVYQNKEKTEKSVTAARTGKSGPETAYFGRGE